MRGGVAHREAVMKRSTVVDLVTGEIKGIQFERRDRLFATREISRGDESGGKIREIYPFTLV